jgi:hypothetical protein
MGDQNNATAQQMKTSSNQEGTTYFIAPDLLVVDISSAPAVGDEGDTVKAYGKAVEMDLQEMLKAFGPEAAKELENDPQLQGQTRFIIFIAKQVDLVQAGDPLPEVPADAVPPADTAVPEGAPGT